MTLRGVYWGKIENFGGKKFQSRMQILTARGVYWKKIENFGGKNSKVGGKF